LLQKQQNRIGTGKGTGKGSKPHTEAAQDGASRSDVSARLCILALIPSRLLRYRSQ
jgi:hypothetical protein